MAPKTENAAKVSTCCLGDIKSQITPEKLPFSGEEQLLYYCKELRLKTTGEKKSRDYRHLESVLVCSTKKWDNLP